MYVSIFPFDRERLSLQFISCDIASITDWTFCGLLFTVSVIIDSRIWYWSRNDLIIVCFMPSFETVRESSLSTFIIPLISFVFSISSAVWLSVNLESNIASSPEDSSFITSLKAVFSVFSTIATGILLNIDSFSYILLKAT